MRARRRLTAATAIAALALSLAACDGVGGSERAAGPEASTPSPTSTVRGSDGEQSGAEPTCDTIIPANVVDDFRANGWSARKDPFYIGNLHLEDGLQCTWGDPTVASDNVQSYGWAPLDHEQAVKAEKELTDDGWRQFEEDGVVYVTAAGDMIMHPDEDGFGMTYRFADDAVTVADTKQGLLLIQWPPAAR